MVLPGVHDYRLMRLLARYLAWGVGDGWVGGGGRVGGKREKEKGWRRWIGRCGCKERRKVEMVEEECGCEGGDA